MSAELCMPGTDRHSYMSMHKFIYTGMHTLVYIMHTYTLMHVCLIYMCMHKYTLVYTYKY